MIYLLQGEESERLFFRNIRAEDFNEWLESHKNPDTSMYWVSEKESPEKECEKWY